MIFWIEGHALIERNTQGEAQRMIGINVDITERKYAEEALLKWTEALERSNKELAILPILPPTI